MGGSGLQEVDAGRGHVEDLGGHAATDLRGIPLLVTALDGDALAPTLHPDDLVVEGTDDLTVDVTGLIAGEPGDKR